jgi:hypothetical protein
MQPNFNAYARSGTGPIKAAVRRQRLRGQAGVLRYGGFDVFPYLVLAISSLDREIHSMAIMIFFSCVS